MFSIENVFRNETVVYECSCGLRKAITLLYLCRHCMKLRCKDCVSHEVDSQYCQHCLEYIPTIDAKLKKNKCASCYVCPSCMHALSTKVFIIQVKNEVSAQPVAKKAYKLVCSFCKWTSKDAGIEDQTAAAGGWPEIEVPESKRIDTLFECYRVVAQREKLEKEKKRISHRPAHAIHLLDKYGISASLSPKVTETLRAKLYSSKFSAANLQFESRASTEVKFEPATALEVSESADLECYYKDDPMVSYSSIAQRLMQIELQPEKLGNFYPISKMLSVKRSLRCKECDHNLSKPEYNPSSIKFKIQLSAYYHVPEIKVKKIPRLENGKPAIFEISVKNPTQYMMRITFFADFPEKDAYSTADILLPRQELLLSPNDETLELDVDQSESSKFKDDPRIISFRKMNKIGLYLQVTPHDVANCKVAFSIRHDFINNVVQIQGVGDKEAQTAWMVHKLFVNLSNHSSVAA